MAERMLISVQTLQRLEAGDPTVGMAVLASALHVFGMTRRLAELVAPETDRVGINEDLARLPRTTHARQQGRSGFLIDHGNGPRPGRRSGDVRVLSKSTPRKDRKTTKSSVFSAGFTRRASMAPRPKQSRPSKGHKMEARFLCLFRKRKPQKSGVLKSFESLKSYRDAVRFRCFRMIFRAASIDFARN